MLALAAKDIPFQKCHTDLREKAEWHKNINGGLVPLLESPDGTIIFESAVIAEFANELKPDSGLPMWPHCAKPGDMTAAFKTG